MKKSIWILPLIFLAAGVCAAFTPSSALGRGPNTASPSIANLQDYGGELDMDYVYNYLSPYGDWINLEPYGYVWAPRHMGYQWRPYCDGHWVWTDDGWTWIADEEWGMIPFHYGRWGYDDDLGWFWVPGTVWGPAWVSWRWSDQYAGWAPLPPGVEFRAGMDFASLSFNIPTRFWVFVQAPHFMEGNLYHYALPYERNVTVINFTTIRNNYQFRNNRFIDGGVGIDDVQRITRRQVTQYALQDLRQPGQARVSGHDVQVYRPGFRRDTAARPQNIISPAQARQELAPAKVFEPKKNVPVTAQQTAVQKRQAEEKSLTQKTQTQEIQTLKNRRTVEQKQAVEPAAKAKVQQTYQTKTADLQKQHQAEKQQLTTRHQQDTQQVKKVVQQSKPQKPTPPPPPPKKKEGKTA